MTQCRVVPGKDVVHVVCQPRPVPELDGPTNPWRRRRQELVESFGVAAPPRRQLNEVRTEVVSEQFDSLEMPTQPVRRVAQLHAMRAELSDLDRIAESGGRLSRPLLDRRRRRADGRRCCSTRRCRTALRSGRTTSTSAPCCGYTTPRQSEYDHPEHPMRARPVTSVRQPACRFGSWISSCCATMSTG